MDIHVIAGHKFKLTIILSFSVLLVLLAIGNVFLGRKFDHVELLRTPWIVSENGGPEKIVSLSDYKIQQRNRLDAVELSYILTEEFDEPKTIMPTVYLCSLEVFLDGELLYTYGTDRVAANRMVGSGTFFINIPPHSAGKKLTLRLVQNEKDGTTALRPISVVPAGEQYHELLVEKLFIFTISVLLVGIGFLFWCNGLILALFNRLFFRLATIGSLSIIIGLWSFTNSQAISLFSMSDNMRLVHTVAEYVLLYTGPIPFCIMLYQLAEIKDLWRRVGLICVGVWSFLFLAGSVILHVTNVVRFPAVLNVYHVNSIICLLLCLLITYAHRGLHSNSEKMFIFSLGMLCFVLVADVLRFDIIKYYRQPAFELVTSFLPVGMLQFVVLAFIGFLIPIYDKAMTMDEKTLLMRLAYTDSLTGLQNRTKCYEMFKMLDRTKANYVLINFDVNGLKFINDTCGHQAGDKLLTVFATCLQDSFGSIGRCFRMGGDEFLVLIQTDYDVDIPQAMKNLQAHAASRSRLWSFSLRYAYGIARNNEVPDGLAKSVYALSDRRMYDMKTSDSSSRTYSELQYYQSMRSKE